MKIVFMGTSSFGLECLQKLIAMKQDISAIYTLPSVINISWSKNPIHLATHKNFTRIAHTNSIPIIEVKEKIKSITQVEYPPMRLVDLYFWLIGNKKDEDKKKR